MVHLVPPHYAEQVKPLPPPAEERSEERRRAQTLTNIPLDSRTISGLVMPAMGA
jgi:hypothetical protein